MLLNYLPKFYVNLDFFKKPQKYNVDIESKFTFNHVIGLIYLSLIKLAF